MRATNHTMIALVATAVFSGGVQSVGADACDPPAGYYNAAESLYGTALKSALHDLIDNHTIVPYSWPPFQAVDESASISTHVDLIYSDATRAKNQNGGNAGDWNREHLWPKSYGIGNDGADTSDIFNLRPSDVQVNSERGSLFFDNTDPGGAIPLQFSAPGCSKDADSWEPRDDEKGDIARSLFYMAVRYDGSDGATDDLELSDSPNSSNSHLGRLITLLQWHRLDPVDELERKRNHNVFTDWQGNRNPFIDRPEFVEQLFLESYPALDTDVDGIVDWWEWRRVGSLAESAMSDTDGDGSPTLLEFLFNEDPSSPAPVPGIEIAGDEIGTTVRYRRNSLADGVVVSIETTATLSAASWQPVEPTNQTSMLIDSESTMVTLTFANTSPSTFYRLRATVPAAP